jgi:hypothetical protein
MINGYIQKVAKFKEACTRLANTLVMHTVIDIGEPPVIEYVQMLSQANALRATLEEKLANARESVKRNALRIIERDEQIAELKKELSALRCVAQSSKPGQGFFTIDQVESLKDQT